MLVVSVVVGMMLAVVSVPVGAVVFDAYIMSGAGKPIVEDRWIRDHDIVTTRYQTPTGTLWLRETTAQKVDPAWIIQYGNHAPSRASVFESVPRNLLLDLDGQDRSVALWLVGWPFECAYGLRRLEPPWATNSHVGVLNPKWPRLDFGIPYLPFWPGLFANTVIYASLALAVVTAVRFARTRRRNKRGRCVACGYELGDGIEVCPECGLPAVVQS